MPNLVNNQCFETISNLRSDSARQDFLVTNTFPVDTSIIFTLVSSDEVAKYFPQALHLTT